MATNSKLIGITFNRAQLMGKVIGTPEVFNGEQGKEALIQLLTVSRVKQADQWSDLEQIVPILVKEENRVEKLVVPHIQEHRQLSIEAFYQSMPSGAHALVVKDIQPGIPGNKDTTKIIGVSFNHAQFMGRVVNDPSIQDGETGKVAVLELLTIVRSPQVSGQWIDREQIVPIFVMDPGRVERVIIPYVKANRQLYIESYYQSWTDGHGFIATEIKLGIPGDKTTNS
jgi:hypothetical protein